METRFTRSDFIRGAGLGLLYPFLNLRPGGARRERDAGSDPPPGDRFLIRGGTVLTMDDRLGMMEKADLLIEKGVIRKVEPEIVTGAEVIEASGRIVMPGFVDTHRHLWQGALRNVLPDGTLSDYMEVIAGQARPVYRPRDARIGNLVSALGALDAGVTTILDWSHIGNSPAHTDAAIEGLRASGIRGVYAFGGGWSNPQNRFPDDIRRLRREQFSAGEGLITLALAAGIDAGQWELARETGARISVHVNGTGDLIPMASSLGPDVTCIHCCNLLDEEWELLAESGAGVSISPPVEMIMGHGVPPVQQVIDHGIRASLSVDVETTVPGDMFAQMLSLFTLQRMLMHASDRARDEKRAGLLTAEEVIRMATLNGAVHNGLGDRTGSLVPGKRADLILLDPRPVHTLAAGHVPGAIVGGMDRSNVEMVMVDGVVRKWNHRLLIEDPGDLEAQIGESRDYLFTAAGWSGPR